MKRSTLVNSLYAAVLVMFCSIPALADADTVSADDWLAELSSMSSADPEAIDRTKKIIGEATEFFHFLSAESLLPSTPAGTASRFRLLLPRPVFALTYPVKIVIDVELKNAASGYQKYTMEKTTPTARWNVLSAVQLNTDDEQIAALNLPSQEDQKKANAKLPELLALAAKDSPIKTVKMAAGEILLLKSAQGQALVMFTGFGDQVGGESAYQWRYKANGDKKEHSGEGSVFEHKASNETAALKKVNKQKKVQAGTIQIEWSHGMADLFAWVYYDSRELEVRKLTLTPFDAYEFK